MMHRWALIGVLGCLAACGARAPERPPLLSITPGTYAAEIGGACVTLAFRSRDRQDYRLDADCDGAAEVTGPFERVEDQIITGDTVMTVTAVGPTSFSGVWQAGEAAQDVRFVRQN